MVVARASGMDLASILKRNTFLTLGVRPARGPGSARDGGTDGAPGRGTRGAPGRGDTGKPGTGGHGGGRMGGPDEEPLAPAVFVVKNKKGCTKTKKKGRRGRHVASG